MDPILNVGFFVFHSAWILFNCIGWIWKRIRVGHLVTVSLTAFSWVGLGPWYGWGYCPCTDWHWQVRARMGYRDPDSYLQLLIRELSGFDPAPRVANMLAVMTLAVVAVLSIALNIRDRRDAPTLMRR